MKMENEREKIALPKELQIRMLEFFMRTSIPRKMREEREKRESDKSTIKKN
jgi:hypothetical protein